MTRIVTFAHDLDDEVQLKTLALKARIIGLRLDFTGESYRVLYWLGGEQRREWVFGCELIGYEVRQSA